VLLTYCLHFYVRGYLQGIIVMACQKSRYIHFGKVHAIAGPVSPRLLHSEARVRSQGTPCGICGGQSGTGTGFSQSPSVFPWHYYSTDAPCLLMYHLGAREWGLVRGRSSIGTQSDPIATIKI
jgi:hypothetical protein